MSSRHFIIRTIVSYLVMAVFLAAVETMWLVRRMDEVHQETVWFYFLWALLLILVFLIVPFGICVLITVRRWRRQGRPLRFPQAMAAEVGILAALACVMVMGRSLFWVLPVYPAAGYLIFRFLRNRRRTVYAAQVLIFLITIGGTAYLLGPYASSFERWYPRKARLRT
ncbi:MAG: hypothetical protein QF593_00225, partial [Nitrospinota bacterium]|nr:hypothetical protein [Nitrospinota bacterium]